MTIVDGSLTIFRGLPSSLTERQEVVLSFPLKAGSVVYKGQVLIYDQATNQKASPNAGFNERGDTNGIARPFAASDSYAGTVLGVCMANIDDSDTTKPEYGTRVVPVLLKGIVLMRCIVNATGTSAGYNIAIGGGDIVAVGGGAGGGSITGSNAVSGFTTATPGAFVFKPTGATGGSSNTVIGWSLDFQDGHATSQTVSDGTVTASAATVNSSTWIRVYVDMFALHAGGTMAKFSV